ncbi:type II toxin-antitoxin system Phd/YefM family antitoxin [Staphylococcus pasteuri]|uniref:type II toxin-antitoxin system Phd/YefM family antitoxin n=1 Tax=Staphylococcus TaxID=1279 RepID=UPI0008A5AEAF|nr:MULTISPECIES: type II toxin-antitoxin system Phd/YefM family antitoxin [Staphylococcus]RQX28161.1 type II toxin-antitoxin system Phd/YefM family antitoxin [Staphylococcus warneri]MCO0861667.1 type II toxin-antitoxin system Phd/YefM family antitoxin [Staphylococcus pasteuri]MCO5359891.1 type II toxin-antitoxin system Phd/YefM family antitoxin [Staphylococcus pasteuri]OFV11504.1 prevent-host-death protein [Staphylococcus sp. HMSC13A10]QDW85549.1 type II toxin-antitoxin system Phd/YefM family 
MTVVFYSYAIKNFRSLINKVNTDLDFVIITTNEHNAVLISENNYNAIMETMYLQQSPANAKHLAKSIADLERGNTTEIDMDSNE